jgi:hypothetical protein
MYMWLKVRVSRTEGSGIGTTRIAELEAAWEVWAHSGELHGQTAR